MPFGDPDPTDPQMLVGVVLPGGTEAMRRMALVFAEEFARLGHGSRQILGLFRNPFYAGAHAAWRALGEPAIRDVVEEAAAAWPQVRIVDAPGAGAHDEEEVG
jgi:hypothetical protein